MLKIGITGGIGTGKSTVAKVFAALEIPVYEADYRAKVLIENDTSIIDKIKGLLGEESYFENGKYNKGFVAQKVFDNPDLLKKLNGIVHPATLKDFSDWASNQKNTPYIIKEAAIMDKNTGLDKIIVVSSPLELRISRIQKRDKRSVEEIENIIKNQKSEEQFLEISDFEIKNNEQDFIITQVLEIDKILRK
jgi:dephospho-CoA kinase